jgi:3-oxoacyl-[acyl-carrier protein] reductase
MDLGLKGRRALVLGGNRGIGFGIAKALAAEGAKVGIAARDADKLKSAAAEIGGKGFQLDLQDIAAIPAFAAKVEAELGGIDIVVNNTGGPAYGGASGRPLDEWRGRFEDMVLSVIALADAVVPGMRKRKWGRILTVVSQGVIQPIPVLGISNTLRSSLVAWSKTLAGEVAADGVTVNVIVPGRIDTERVRLTDEAVATREKITPEEARKRSWATIPMGRYGTTEEIGAMAAFLASERAGYVTGSMVRVDGGIVRSI